MAPIGRPPCPKLSRVARSRGCWLHMRPVESMGHTDLATATAAAAVCVAFAVGHVLGAVVDVEKGPGGGGGGGDGGSIDGRADQRQRHNSGVTDGTADRRRSRRWSHRRHPRRCQHRQTCARSRRVPPTGGQHTTSRHGKTRAMGFFGVLGTKSYFAASWRNEFCGIVSCGLVSAGLKFCFDHKKSRQATDADASVIGSFFSNPLCRVFLYWMYRLFTSHLDSVVLGRPGLRSLVAGKECRIRGGSCGTQGLPWKALVGYIRRCSRPSP